MNHCSHGIDGLLSDLSPIAPPFAIDSSSFFPTASKSENDDSFWVDYTLDLSFLSSDDQRSTLNDDDSLSNLSRVVETTKEGKEKIARSGKVLLNPNSSKVIGDDKLDLSCAKTSVMSEKSSSDSDQDDSEEDSPCWIGIHSRKTLASGTKSVTSRHSTDDLSGFHRLNPLAPQFIPSTSKRNLDMDGKECVENSSLSLKNSMSSVFPSSSGELNLIDPPEGGRKDAARGTSILTHNADEKFGFVSSDSLLSKTVSLSDSINEFQPSKRLDPLAPVFVPSTAKLSPSVHEKQVAFETNAYPASTLTSSDNKSPNNVNVVTCSGEVGNIFKSQHGVHELGTTSSYNPGIESEVETRTTEYAKLGSTGNKSHGQKRLNPLAPQFFLADSKPEAYGYEQNQAADDLSLMVNTAGLSGPAGYRDHNADLAQSSVYVERHLPNMFRGSSSLISPEADSNFGPTKWFATPKTTLSVKGNKDFKHPLPFRVIENAASSSSSVRALTGMDVKKLLTTMHGLSELLKLANASESSNPPNVEELDLVNSTVQNLNLYIKNGIQEHARNQNIARCSSYDRNLLPNKSKLSSRDLQLPGSDNMTVDLDVKRKEKYSVVSGETLPYSRLSEFGATKDNNFGEVMIESGYQQNHQGQEQTNPQALFYKSLWLKAEAERCLMIGKEQPQDVHFLIGGYKGI